MGYTIECALKGPWIHDNRQAHEIDKIARKEGIMQHGHRDLRKGVPEGMERTFLTHDGMPRCIFRDVKGRKTAAPRTGSDSTGQGSVRETSNNDPAVDFTPEDFRELVEAMEKEGLKLNEKSRQAATAIAQAVTNSNLTPREVREAAIALSLPEGTADALAKVAAGVRPAVTAIKSARVSPPPAPSPEPEASTSSSSSTSSTGSKKKRRKKGKGRR